VKFKIDENLPEELCHSFRSAGWDCATVVQQQLGGQSDPKVVEVYKSEGRILVTFDRGFSNIRRYPPKSFPGMIVFRLRSQDMNHVFSVAARLIKALTERELRNELWVVHETRIRIRNI